jgi:hypothetical protein
MACRCRTCGKNFDGANNEVGQALNRSLCPITHNGPFDPTATLGNWYTIIS